MHDDESCNDGDNETFVWYVTKTAIVLEFPQLRL